jgi:hypothetical protein
VGAQPHQPAHPLGGPLTGWLGAQDTLLASAAPIRPALVAGQN